MIEGSVAYVGRHGDVQGGEDHVERVKDVINVGDEVEARVIKVDKVERRIGLSIKATGYSEDELKALCEASVGKYKAPKVVYFFDDLPKGPSGKILRLKLPDLIEKSR